MSERHPSESIRQSSPAPEASPSTGLSSTGPFVPGSEASTIDHPGSAPEPNRCLGDYRLFEELGQGGMGVVYRALQQSANRIVALKVVRPDRLADLPVEQRDRWLARFQTEAQAAARLEHDHIVTVYEVGEAEGTPFYSMHYVEGESLGDLLAVGPVPPTKAAAYLEPVVRAVHHAHSHGVLHRDLKPRNILVDREGRPYVTDFGLAKLLEATDGPTHTGDWLGTPSYASPEQAESSAHVQPASDIYSLGATLYALLTGRPPFQASTLVEILHQVKYQEPVAPRRLNPNLPRDLETITLKCLHKEPAKRYASAEALAEDLRRFLAGKPVRARPVGAGERLVRWTRRHPATASLIVGVVTSVLALVLVLLWSNFTIREREKKALELASERDSARKSAETNLALARAEEKKALGALLEERRTNYFKSIALAHLAFRTNDVGGMEELLRACPKEFRSWEWEYLNRLLHKETFLFRFRGPVRVAMDQRLRFLATAANNEVKVWSPHDGREIITLTVDRGSIAHLAFSPGGDLLAAQTRSAYVQLWEVPSGKKRPPLKIPRKPSVGGSRATQQGGLCFSPDGRQLVSANNKRLKGRVLAWDTQSGKTVWDVEPSPGNIDGVAVSPDGKQIAIGASAGSRLTQDILVLDAGNGRVSSHLRGHQGNVFDVAFSADGRTLASACGDQTVRLWNLATGKLQLTLPHPDEVRGVAFSPKGNLLFSGCDDGVIRSWSTDGGPGPIYRGHRDRISRLVCSSSHIASASADGTVRLWHLHRSQEVYQGPTGSVYSLEYSPNGRQLVVQSRGYPGLIITDRWGKGQVSLPTQQASGAYTPDGGRIVAARGREVGVWDAAVYDLVLHLKQHKRAIWGLDYSPDGKRIASASKDGTVKVWDAGTGLELLTLKDTTPPVAFSSDGQRLAAGSKEGSVRVWDSRTGEELFVLKEHSGPILSVAFSVDGKHIATAAGSDIKMWDAQTGKELLSRKGPTQKVSVKGFSPDCRHVVSDFSLPSYRGLKVWEAHTGREICKLKGHTKWVSGIDFSPDGKRIVSGSGDKTVKVWDAHTGELLHDFKGHSDIVWGVAFSPDGKSVASVSSDKTVRHWDLVDGRCLRVLRGYRSFVTMVVFSPDGQRLVTADGGGDRSVRVWSIGTRDSQRGLFGLIGHKEKVVSVAVSSDGRRVASGSADKTAKVWDLENRKVLLTLKGHTSWVSEVAFSPDGKRLATGSGNTVRVWDAREGSLLHTLEGHDKRIQSLTFHPKGTTLATCGDDRTVKLWNVHTGALIRTLRGHTDRVTCVRYTREGRRLVTGSRDRTIRIWDEQTGQLILTLSGHKTQIRALAFSPDGKFLASAGAHHIQHRGEMMFWDATPVVEVANEK